MSETANDAMYAFAQARLREDRMLGQRAVALNALLAETIWPLIGTDNPMRPNAERALRLFVWQWPNHPDYREEWRV